jgi:hypothetical protein
VLLDSRRKRCKQGATYDGELFPQEGKEGHIAHTCDLFHLHKINENVNMSTYVSRILGSKGNAHAMGQIYEEK